MLKAISLTQPWATLIAIGAKRIETRAWSTPYRGRIAIHAAKGLSPIGGKRGYQELCSTQPFERVWSRRLEECGAMKSAYAAAWSIPLGAIVATANLVKCLPTDGGSFLIPSDDSNEWAFGDYSPNRHMWFFENVKRLRQPIECKGALSLWTVPPDV